MSNKPDLWSHFPEFDNAEISQNRHFRWVIEAVLPLSLITMAGVLVFMPDGLDYAARCVLFIFLCSVILWTGTSINSSYIALVAVLASVLSGGIPQDKLFFALGSNVIWLMIGAFILGGAVQKTGLAARMTSLIVSRVTTVRGIFWLMTTVLVPLTLVVPSTSGRAAIALPVFRSIAQTANDQMITRALAILVPTVILVSTSSTLIAAGSHLIAVDLLEQFSGVRISYTEWLIFGLPFGIAASYLSAWVVITLFLEKAQQERILKIETAGGRKFSVDEKTTLVIVFAMVLLWLTEGWHGLEIATVSIVGALLLTAPVIGVLKWRDSLKFVSWNLVIFVGAALVMGEALISTGAAQWIIESQFASNSILSKDTPLVLLLALSLITVTSHSYITSHSARVAALLPGLLFLASSLNLNPTAVLFISVVGINYCLTFPVSSKALLMFYEIEEETYQASDLLRLSAVLLIVHVLLIIGFYFGYWQWIGLAL